MKVIVLDMSAVVLAAFLSTYRVWYYSEHFQTSGRPIYYSPVS